MEYGLLGEKLGHSFSGKIHALFGNENYKLCELSPSEFSDFLQKREFRAANVTIPYKEKAMAFCDYISPEAKKIGSVNTLVCDARKGLCGYNTDFNGFLFLAEQSGICFKNKKTLILGSGGTSKAVFAAVTKLCGEPVVISRAGADNYENIGLHADAKIIVNTTPVGMFPKGGETPLTLDCFTRLEAVFDVIYNPQRTRILQEAQAKGAAAFGGLMMLVAQAAFADMLFFGKNAPPDILETYQKILKQQENIVLIGMPGSGKSTAAKLLAKRTGKLLIDTDEEIIKRHGRVEEIFQNKGEEFFRKAESEVIAECGAGQSAVISTGGGAVLRRENVFALRQNGKLFYIKRDVETLEKSGRPLSTNLPKMAKEREPIYKAAADFEIDNNGEIEVTVRRILEKI